MKRRHVVVGAVVVLVAAAIAALAVVGNRGHGSAAPPPPANCSVYLGNGAAIVVLTTRYAKLACASFTLLTPGGPSDPQTSEVFDRRWRWQTGDRTRKRDPATGRQFGKALRRVCTGRSSTATIRVYDSGRQRIGTDVCRVIAADDSWTLQSD